ncbi:FAD-dependent monooxygenase [Streptomyces crystallinus]|uniref:FAD-dependent monooxygenase n=1 Tax=Streptomyces crystallinus TaxID=68191 RepID=A0ABP3PUB4_9ACTN
MDNFDADVIIAGAGPTGLMLAGELRLNGVSVIVVDRLAEPIQQSRALGFSARTIEEFGQRGLLERFGGVDVIPVGHFGGVSIDYRLVEGGSYGARGIPQSRTEGVLAGWAGQLGAEVRRGVEVTGLEDGADGVTVEVATPEGPATLRGRYLVGADGARSAVRKLAGIDFPGTDPAIELRFADISGVPLRPRFSGERVPGGMVMVLPLGPERCRIVYFDRSEPLRKSPDPITFDEVAEAFKRLSGEDISGATVHWVSTTTDVSRQAAEYRKGRVFLAGDAAHIHLPIGAQGMSAGVQDAVNLGWKLALEIKGQAPEGLLDTYHSERHPVGARVLTNTLAQRILYLGGDEITPLLDVFTELAGFEDVQKTLIGMVTGLDIRHDVGEGDHPLLGRRLKDEELVVNGEKTTNFELLAAGKAVLFDLTDDSHLRELAAGWADRVTTVTAEQHDCDNGLDAFLVRPDGYVAWVSPSASRTEGLVEALNRWFGRPN